jgi:hypothetical protein
MRYQTLKGKPLTRLVKPDEGILLSGKFSRYYKKCNNYLRANTLPYGSSRLEGLVKLRWITLLIYNSSNITFPFPHNFVPL